VAGVAFYNFLSISRLPQEVKIVEKNTNFFVDKNNVNTKMVVYLNSCMWIYERKSKMAKRKIPQPTNRELAILRVLWERGPSTVRQVNEVLNQERPTGYTTALKLMQLMTEKGLVRRDESQRTHVYRAQLAEERTQRQLVRDLLDRAFGGSAEKLVMQALSSKKVSSADLAKIRQMLDELEGR